MNPDENAETSWFQKLRNRYEALIAEYGSIAIAVYLVLFFGSIAVFYVLIELGFEVSGNLGEVGKIGAAYAAAKVLQPVRILGTLVLTPIVANVKHRLTGHTSGSSE